MWVSWQQSVFCSSLQQCRTPQIFCQRLYCNVSLRGKSLMVYLQDNFMRHAWPDLNGLLHLALMLALTTSEVVISAQW